MELEIIGKVYKFRFGIGFLKDINTRYKDMHSMTVQVPAGFKYTVCQMLENRDMTALADILLTANKTESPRLSSSALEDYLDDESTDIDALVQTVTDFLSQANACKGQMEMIEEALEEAKAKKEQYEKLKKMK